MLETNVHGVHDLGRKQECPAHRRFMEILGLGAELIRLTVLMSAQGLPSLLTQAQ